MMTAPITPDSAQLGRFLDRAASADDLAAIGAWRRHDPLWDALLQQLHTEAAKATPDDVAAVWSTVRARSGFGVEIERRTTTDGSRRSATPRRGKPLVGRMSGGGGARWRWIAGIASVAAAIAVAAVWYPAHTVKTANAVAYERLYRTGPAQRATVTLPDGSTVVLAPSTTLTYAMAAGTDGPRSITLMGEALFDVASDPRRPFIVRSGMSVTRVLGTRFSVRRYDDDAIARVVVASGRVSFNTVLLQAGDVGELDSDGVPVVAHDRDTDALLSWAHGRLVFTNARLTEVAAQMSRWYNVTVVVTDPALAAQRVNLVIDRDPRTPAQARVIGDAIGARVERDGNVLKLIPAGP